MRLFIPLIFCLATVIDGYKIVVFSQIFGHSHANFMGRLADILTEKGHNVTVVMPVVDKNEFKRNGVHVTKNIKAVMPSEATHQAVTTMKAHMFKTLWDLSPDILSQIQMAPKMGKLFKMSCEDMLNDDGLFEELKNSKFDLGIAEPFSFCGLAMLEALKIPVTVAALSAVQNDVISSYLGEPAMSSYVPNLMSTDGAKMGFFSRAKNLMGSIGSVNFYETIYKIEHEAFVQKFGPGFKSVQDICTDVSYVLTNSHPYLNFVRPINPKTIDIGGITLNKEKLKSKLNDEEISKYLDERKHTVLLSFGSVAKSKDMPEKYKMTIKQAFKEMPDVTFIWKYEEDSDFADDAKNIHLVKWIPQVALLNDDRLDLFITHGGLGSTTEVAHLGKPTIFVPIFADQPRNAMMLSRFNASLVMEKTELVDVETIKKNIRTILNDHKYKENAKRLAEILNTNPNDPTETFVKHIEFAAKVGKIPNLVAESQNLSFVQLYMLDVVSFVVCVVVVTLSIILFALYALLSCIFKKKVKTE